MFKKAEQTRKKILDASYQLFRERGFEKSTLRGVAEKAGIAPGGIYYYFQSKEHLVQDFYAQTQTEHEEASKGLFEKHGFLTDRLRELVRLKIKLAMPYRELSRALYKAAADPNSPLSPFSDESSQTRRKAQDQFVELVESVEDSLHPELKSLLPFYLWLYEMGVILFWIYDRSPKSKRTFQFINSTTSVIARVLELFHNPLFRPFRKEVLKLLKEYHNGPLSQS